MEAERDTRPADSAVDDQPIHRPKSVCRGCFDLNYDLFWSSNGLNYPSGGSANSRYRISSLERIYTAASRSCQFCCIIRKAFESICEELNVETSTVFGTGENEVEAEVSDNEEAINDNHIIDRRLQKTFPLEETRKYNIFLVLEPYKPLTIVPTPTYIHWPYLVVTTRLEIYTEADVSSHFPAFGHASTVPPHLNIDHCIKSIQNWLQHCNEQHEACLPPSRYLPTRLVQITDETVRLVETDSLEYSPYLTLSHCWGKNPQMLRTTTQTLEQRKSEIAWIELPAVFKDALTIMQRIGYQWMWIDSLCIVQDDEDDWREESSKMADVYSNSSLNIAATFSPNSHQTFFTRRKHFTRSNLPMESEMQVKSHIVSNHDGTQTRSSILARISHWTGHHMIAGEMTGERPEEIIDPLLQRAWVLQERLLAPRTIHIGSSELTWECNTTLACECNGISDFVTSLGDFGLKPSFASACSGRYSKPEILDLWYLIVSVYSALNLTKPTDRPQALAGIASRLSGFLESDYTAGIWSEDILRGLLWNVVTSDRGTVGKMGPSWSWMSSMVSTTYRVVREVDQHLRVELKLDKSADEPGAGVPGKTVHGQLLVTGFVCRGTLVDGTNNAATGDMSSPTTFVQIGGINIYWTKDSTGTSERETGTPEVLCLVGGTTGADYILGLVLMPLAIESHYSRIGTTYCKKNDDPFRALLEHGQVRQFTLV